MLQTYSIFELNGCAALIALDIDKITRCSKDFGRPATLESGGIYTSKTGYPVCRQSTTHARGVTSLAAQAGVTVERCLSRVQLPASLRRVPPRVTPSAGDEVRARPLPRSSSGSSGGGGGGGESWPSERRSLYDRLCERGTVGGVARPTRPASCPTSAIRRRAGWSAAVPVPAARRGNVRPPPNDDKLTAAAATSAAETGGVIDEDESRV